MASSWVTLLCWVARPFPPFFAASLGYQRPRCAPDILAARAGLAASIGTSRWRYAAASQSNAYHPLLRVDTAPSKSPHRHLLPPCLLRAPDVRTGRAKVRRQRGVEVKVAPRRSSRSVRLPGATAHP
ncbi:hypothetical protein Vafri_21872 [Volvox africanus]|uniref:Secreted protein n=1 Tax=Volvox africanus TaxID=51714 RepID=A0A8J4BZP2_9CHLO|nr:hypothetical protein Vafri_21872 [Volvox africanus]